MTPASTKVGLTDDQRIEYAEINAAWRHDDTMAAALAALTYPITFGAFFAAFTTPQARFALAIGSLVLYLIYLAMESHIHSCTKGRLARARELEEIGGLQGYNRNLWIEVGMRSVAYPPV